MNADLAKLSTIRLKYTKEFINLIVRRIYAVLFASLFVSFITLFNFQNTEATNGNHLVARYVFRNNADDTSGSNNNGAISGNIRFVKGVFGKGLCFDGSTAIVSVPNSPSLNFGKSKSFSVSAWLKSTQSGVGDSAFGWIVDHRLNNDGIYAGYTVGDYSGIIQARIRDNAAHDVPVYSDTNINDGRWHHVVFVVDRLAQEERLYIDNNLEDSANTSSVGNINTGFDLHLGGTTYPGTPLNFFDGTLDDVRIYDKALSETHIGNLFDKAQDLVDDNGCD